MTINNFNCTTEPIAIKMNVYRDSDLAEINFNDELYRIDKDMYVLRDGRDIEINKLDLVSLKDDLPVGSLIPFIKDMIYIEDELLEKPYDDSLYDIVQDKLYEMAIEDIQDTISIALDYSLPIEYNNYYPHTSIGYSGESILVLIPHSLDTVTELLEYVDHLLYDEPMYIDIVIGEKLEFFTNDLLANEYEYSKDESIENMARLLGAISDITKNQKEYILSFLEKNLPEEI